MSRFLRRFATFILLLTVPLRVYAAAAMIFCGPASEVPDVESAVSAHHQIHKTTASGTLDEMGHVGLDHGAGAALTLHWSPDPQHADEDVAPTFHDHFSCAACCCAGMISTAGVDWKPQPSPAPATPSFVAIAVPTMAPQRLDRPPKAVVA